VAGSGLVGRNGTGKTTLLKHMAMHAIDGIPRNCQILHVEQEVVGDDTTVLQCVLDSDVERKQLLEEEAQLAQQVCTDVALILFSKPSPCSLLVFL
jgi:ATP-binding cassette subfamily F protein 3